MIQSEFQKLFFSESCGKLIAYFLEIKCFEKLEIELNSISKSFFLLFVCLVGWATQSRRSRKSPVGAVLLKTSHVSHIGATLDEESRVFQCLTQIGYLLSRDFMHRMGKGQVLDVTGSSRQLVADSVWNKGKVMTHVMTTNSLIINHLIEPNCMKKRMIRPTKAWVCLLRWLNLVL